jgi:L-ribulose-5-phosphate 3-epimerase UlaE
MKMVTFLSITRFGRVVNNVEELISTVYPDIFNLSNKSYQWLCERAIISPRNVTAGEINDINNSHG